MNKRELCKRLRVSRPTLDKYFNQFGKELEPYIKRVNGRFTDFNEEGVEVLRHLAYTPPKEQSFEVKNRQLMEQIYQLNKELEVKTALLSQKDEIVDILKKSNEELIADKRNLQSDLEYQKAKNNKLGNHLIVKLLGLNNN